MQQVDYLTRVDVNRINIATQNYWRDKKWMAGWFLDAIQAIQVEHTDHIYLFQSYRNQQSLNRLRDPLSRRAVSMAFSIKRCRTSKHRYSAI